MDGLIAGLGTAALGAALVFEFVADRATGTPLEVATPSPIRSATS